jgi:flap endonuclease-1
MGIKNLLKFLSNNNIVNQTDISKYQNKKIAIDISILIYQVVISIRNTGNDLLNSKGEIISHIFGIFNKTIYFLEKGIIPVYVFDGKPPGLKKKILELRSSIRKKALDKLSQDIELEDRIKYLKRSVYITKQQIEDCKYLLNLMGIPFVEAPEEADSELAYLCKTNLVYAVLTEDMDILTFGSPRIIRNLSTSSKNYLLESKKPIQVELNDVLHKLNLSYEQFIELCILFGCDYCSNISDIKQDDIYKTYIKYRNIENTLEDFKNRGYNVTNINYKEAKEYFINSKYKYVDNNDLCLKQPDINKLLDLLVNEHGLLRYKVINKLRKLELFYSVYKNI